MITRHAAVTGSPWGAENTAAVSSTKELSEPRSPAAQGAELCLWYGASPLGDMVTVFLLILHYTLCASG